MKYSLKNMHLLLHPSHLLYEGNIINSHSVITWYQKPKLKGINAYYSIPLYYK